jgi:histidinol-phosphate aminotransferase
MTAAWINQVQHQIQDLHPYLPGKPIETVAKELGVLPENIIKLASNENPLGISPKVRQAILEELPHVGRYPDNDALSLKATLAKKLGVKSSQLTLGSGSCEVLDMIGRVFLGKGKSAMYSQHAFAAYPILTQTLGANHQVVRAKEYKQDLQSFLQQKDDTTAVMFVTNPSNPTGSWVTKTELLAFLEQVPSSVIVVLDEAYIEYVNQQDMPNGIDLLPHFPNLVVTRTFSKAYGLAGMRVGYGISSPEIAQWLNRVRQPFNVNALALKAAQVALEDTAFLAAAVEINQQGMAYFLKSFEEMTIDYIPSRGNFITIDASSIGVNVTGKDMFEALQKKGIITRPIGNYEMPNHLRISIGTDEENRKCIDAIGVLKSKGIL